MPVDVQLAQLVLDYRVETDTNSTAVALLQGDDDIRVRLRRMQELLWMQHLWPHMKIEVDVTLVAGTRYYAWPALALEYTGVRQVWFCDGSGDWSHEPVQPGIEPWMNNEYDSDAGETNDMVYRWQHIDDQIEVWPIPSAAAAGKLRLVGNRSLRPLVQDTDRCDLDSNLLVLFTAAEDLADRNPPKSEALQAKAQQHMQATLGRMDPGHGTRFYSNLGRGTRRWRKNKDYVPTGA